MKIMGLNISHFLSKVSEMSERGWRPGQMRSAAKKRRKRKKWSTFKAEEKEKGRRRRNTDFFL